MNWNCSCNIKQLGARGGKVYVTVTGKGMSVSSKTVKNFKAERIPDQKAGSKESTFL